VKISTGTQLRLERILKSAHDTMRKDAGLSSDLDRTPQLSWLLFLKAFDAVEERREGTDARYRRCIEGRYRWRSWAVPHRVGGPGRLSGEALLRFVNDDLLPHLRGLTGATPDDPRNVISSLFREVQNRMLSGSLLEELVTKVDEIDFTSEEDIHTMAFLYERILRQVRDAAGTSGEFYTPRPVIRFMVQQSFPTKRDIILDPACGTGGFLVEALEELDGVDRSTIERQRSYARLRGIEKKPLPYLLSVMNLVLHGVDNPSVVRDNALTRMRLLRSQRDRPDLVLTNPPFGGEEELAIVRQFKEVASRETSWLFLWSIMDCLKAHGRCAIVVPNAVLFAGGAGRRVKERLLSEFNLHTVVRLPEGVFAPYTDIPTNLLFFEGGNTTSDIWFYELPVADGRRKYTKTKPLKYREFDDCREWWGGGERLARRETERAWKVSCLDVIREDYNLDRRHPVDTGRQLASLRSLLDELIELHAAAGTLVTQLDRQVKEHYGK
jgi:type I restriction enzyme M protein